MRAWTGLLVAGLLVGVPAGVSAAAASPEGTARSQLTTLTARSAACPTGWGSTAEARSVMTAAPVSGVRSGRHACYDRLVVDVAGPVRGYSVRYVTTVREDGSGFAVPVRGGAKLKVVVRAPAYADGGDATYQPDNRRELVPVGGYSTFRQVAWAGSFEGQSTLGLGVRARLPFRVLIVDGPGSRSRLVIDVAHRW
jgi:hypothetical protein